MLTNSHGGEGGLLSTYAKMIGGGGLLSKYHGEHAVDEDVRYTVEKVSEKLLKKEDNLHQGWPDKLLKKGNLHQVTRQTTPARNYGKGQIKFPASVLITLRKWRWIGHPKQKISQHCLPVS